MLSRLILSSFFICTSVFLSAASAQASPAQRYLEARHAQAKRLLAQRPSTEAAKASRARKLDRLLGSLLDFEELSRRSLGSHWTERSAKDRETFVSLLRQLVERNYRNSLEKTLQYEVRYVGEESSEKGTVVRTLARSTENRRAPEVSIDYALHQVGGAYRVYDLTTDGVSMVRTYRSQFDRIIRRDGWEALIERMRSRLGSDESAI